MDVPYLVRRAAREFPDALAVDDAHRALTTGALVARAERLANALDDLGARPGGMVGVLSENRTEYVEVDVAIALAGRVRVALNARLALADFRYMVEDSGMDVLVHSGGFAEEATALREQFGLTTVSLDAGDAASPWYEDLIEAADPVRRSRPEDDEAPAWVTYTSGTTGRPKGVVLSHRSLREVAINLLVEFGPVRPGEQLVLTQALSHGAGYFVLPYLLRGAGVYVMRRFDAEEVWRVSERDAVRALKAVPAMLPALIDHDGPEAWGYETTIYGASPISDTVLEAALDRFGPTLTQGYGQSEAPATITCLSKADHLLPDARSSAGRPWRTVAVEVRDPEGQPVRPGELGEVVVRGNHMMTGYLGNPEATAAVMENGWVRTKDMARVDERGFVYLQGRNDEIINTGGYNVAPREVEEVLVTHPSVLEAVVVGVPDERWGSAVTAVVQARPGATIDGADLMAFVRPRLGIRTPKRVVVIDAIPRTPYGKVDRTALGSHLEGVAP